MKKVKSPHSYIGGIHAMNCNYFVHHIDTTIGNQPTGIIELDE